MDSLTNPKFVINVAILSAITTLAIQTYLGNSSKGPINAELGRRRAVAKQIYSSGPLNSGIALGLDENIEVRPGRTSKQHLEDTARALASMPE